MYTFGLESISRQSDAFFKELTAAVKETRENYGRNKTSDDIDDNLKHIAAVIKHHTNLIVTPSVGTMHGPSITVPDLYRNSAIRSPFNAYLQNADLQRKLWENDGVVVGKVDYKNGYVDGYYAEVPFVMYLPSAIFKASSGFTNGEIAAIMLHEVGHAFVYLSLLAYTATTSLLMTFISNKWVSATPKDREHWLVSINRTRGNDAIDVKELAKTDDVKVVEVVVISTLNETIRSEIGFSYYEMVAFETMADNYATRYGAGRELATALDKIYTSAANIQKRSFGVYLFVEVFKTLPYLLKGNVFISIWRTVAGRLISYDFGSPLYDTPFDRIGRIRLDMIDVIKDFDLSGEDKEAAIAGIAELDKILDTTKDHRQFVSLVLEKIPFTKTAQQRKGALFYRELEMLASSNLYVRSAELDTLKGN